MVTYYSLGNLGWKLGKHFSLGGQRSTGKGQSQIIINLCLCRRIQIHGLPDLALLLVLLKKRKLDCMTSRSRSQPTFQ